MPTDKAALESLPTRVVRLERENERLREALKSFPLPSQIDGMAENYHRILDWLYKPDGKAALIVDLSMGKSNRTTCAACDGSGAALPMLPLDDPANGLCEACGGDGTVSQTTVKSLPS